MANLTVWKFDSPKGAQQALNVITPLQKEHLIEIQDAAIVEWEEGKKKPKTKQGVSTTGAGALSGGFWGMLFGLLFFIPFVGLAIGAAMGALMGHFRDYGINDDFIESVRSEVTPGTSALFLYSESSAPDKVISDVKAAGLNPTLISSNMTAEQDAALKAAFAEE